MAMMNVIIIQNHRLPFVLFYQANDLTFWNFPVKDIPAVNPIHQMASLATQVIVI
jgi:hypothetical protein